MTKEQLIKEAEANNTEIMELKAFLNEALKEQFKATAIVSAIGNKIESIAAANTFEMYKGTTIVNDGMEYELAGVSAYFYPHDCFSQSDIWLRLAFFCTESRLSKDKKEKLEQARLQYKLRKNLPDNNYKIPLWKELCYEVELESVLSGEINLNIE